MVERLIVATRSKRNFRCSNGIDPIKDQHGSLHNLNASLSSSALPLPRSFISLSCARWAYQRSMSSKMPFGFWKSRGKNLSLNTISLMILTAVSGWVLDSFLLQIFLRSSKDSVSCWIEIRHLEERMVAGVGLSWPFCLYLESLAFFTAFPVYLFWVSNTFRNEKCQHLPSLSYLVSISNAQRLE